MKYKYHCIKCFKQYKSLKDLTKDGTTYKCPNCKSIVVVY